MLCTQESVEDGAVVLILANKVDLVDEDVKPRAVSTNAGKSLADVIIIHSVTYLLFINYVTLPTS